MSKEKEAEAEAAKIANLLADSMLEHLHEVVVPKAKGYVEIFEAKLNQFNWRDDENRLEEISTEFAKEYNNLEQRLFDEFDNTVFSKVFSSTSTNGTVFREELKEKINNYLNNIAAEPLERVINYAKNKK